MSSLIRMHALELCNLTEKYNTQISPTLLNETYYKIKCKFKSFTKKFFITLNLYILITLNTIGHNAFNTVTYYILYSAMTHCVCKDK